jgi:hypothetical protein
MIRQQRYWCGTQLVVEDTPEGLLLKPAPLFAPTWPEDVVGSLASYGPPKSPDEMDASVLAEAQQRHAGG